MYEIMHHAADMRLGRGTEDLHRQPSGAPWVIFVECFLFDLCLRNTGKRPAVFLRDASLSLVFSGEAEATHKGPEAP